MAVIVFGAERRWLPRTQVIEDDDIFNIRSFRLYWCEYRLAEKGPHIIFQLVRSIAYKEFDRWSKGTNKWLRMMADRTKGEVKLVDDWMLIARSPRRCYTKHMVEIAKQLSGGSEIDEMVIKDWLMDRF